MLSVPAFARPADVSSSSGEHVALADSLIGTSPPGFLSHCQKTHAAWIRFCSQEGSLCENATLWNWCTVFCSQHSVSVQVYTQSLELLAVDVPTADLDTCSFCRPPLLVRPIWSSG